MKSTVRGVVYLAACAGDIVASGSGNSLERGDTLHGKFSAKDMAACTLCKCHTTILVLKFEDPLNDRGLALGPQSLLRRCGEGCPYKVKHKMEDPTFCCHLSGVLSFPLDPCKTPPASHTRW